MNNYPKPGLKCGIEIHQRLDTKKLFCECSSGQQNEPELNVLRKLRPVAGELGDVDPAALHEALREKHFVYKLSPGESCLVELDCEPPHDINKDALMTGLGVCKMLDCTIPEEIHVMRKTVIDGSNTGGFQRTAVIGMHGTLKMPWGDVKIEQIALEEESARIESRSKSETIYRLSGLGIPLVEITTGIVDSPEKAQQLAEHLGMLLRSFKVQRGIGTIRQDVNISIAKGSRVEIKGFQELGEMAKLVKTEIKRQQDLLRIKDMLQKRAASVKGGVADVTKEFRATKNNLLHNIISNGGRVFAMTLAGFSGILREECGDRTLGKELAGYAKAHGIGGIIHTDEDIVKYKLVEEFRQLKELYGKRGKKGGKYNPDRDAFVIVAGEMPDCWNAANAVYERAAELLAGIPEETRFADGIGSRFARPLPGKARMYPETDVPPVISKFFIPKTLPKTIFEKEHDLKKQLSNELAEQLMHSRMLPLYEKLARKYEPVLVANTLLSTIKDLRRQGLDTAKFGEDELNAVFSFVKEGRMSRQAIPEALSMLCRGKSLKEIENSFKAISENELRDIVASVIRANRGKSEGTIMGIVMGKIAGKADGKLVARIVKEEMG